VKELLKLTAHELMERFAAGEVKPEEFCDLQLRFARQVQARVRSFLSFCQQPARPPVTRPAARALWGIPVSVKDNLTTEDLPTTAGSRILEGYVPPYTATAVKLLRQAGNYLTGKTNLDEFGMGSSTENSGFFPTRNPWDLQRVPGGSSGGSAASVAALQSVVSLGTDTGGSVRQPASFCGVVGFLPTYGFVSRHGLIAFASSLDQVGVLARDVLDIALVLNVIAQPDSLDATNQSPAGFDFAAAAEDTLAVAGCAVGVIRQLMDPALIDAEVLAACEESLRILKEAGCRLVPVELPCIEQLLPCYYILSPAECSSNLARYDGIRYGAGFPADRARELQEHYRRVRSPGFGDEVKRRILLGTYVLSAGYAEAYYNQARRVRHLIATSVAETFREVDFLFLPTSPVPAFKLGERTEDPVAMYAADVCTVLASLCSIPALALPAQLSKDGLPIGIQLLAPRRADGRLLAFGRLYEREAGLAFRVPPLIEQALAGFTA